MKNIEAQNPESIVFDLGNVLVDFSLDGFIEFLRINGCALQTKADFIRTTKMADYEHGKISTTSFLNHVSTLLNTTVDTDEIATRWSNIFTPSPIMLELARELSANYRVFVLSNTNELHLNHIEKSCNIREFCEDIVASFEVGFSKPDPNIFEYTERTHNLDCARTVFIDDLIENVEGARSFGWHAIHHTSPSQTAQFLINRGIKLEKKF